jgi:2,4-dienoyl-CoA reductase-like NADH-dependent reductase (Old Yellow Enzyme family)
VGGITHAQTADTFIREGQVDLVAVGRAFLKNPNWAVDAKQTLDKQS